MQPLGTIYFANRIKISYQKQPPATSSSSAKLQFLLALLNFTEGLKLPSTREAKNNLFLPPESNPCLCFSVCLTRGRTTALSRHSPQLPTSPSPNSCHQGAEGSPGPCSAPGPSRCKCNYSFHPAPLILSPGGFPAWAAPMKTPLLPFLSFCSSDLRAGLLPSPQPSFGQPCLGGTSCTIGSTYLKARVRHQACSDFIRLSLVLRIKGRGVASLRFLAIFPAYVRGTSHADDISCLGRAWLLKTRASWTRRADRNRCTSPHYSSPSANCCLSSSSSGNDVQLINPYQAAAEATKQLRLVRGSRNEAAHQCISAAASLPASKRTWKPSPASRGW